MPKPLCIDLFCGLGGWTEGFIAEGYDVVGFDIERHQYGEMKYPAQLVLQDVLTIHGSQFRNADCIVASPPCQKYSWLAMPWSRSKSEHSQAAKALRREWETNGPDNRLFDACFRIQREACEAAGRYIPLVVENVRGAQEWVGIEGPCDHIPMEERWRRGRSAWNHGSFHLWGDVPALMPMTLSAPKGFGGGWFHNKETGSMNPSRNPQEFLEGQKTQGGSWFRERNGIPQPGIRHEDRGLKGLVYETEREVPEGTGKGSWFFGNGRKDPRDIRKNENGDWVMLDGTKIGGDWFRDPVCHSKHASRSSARKAASAQIAKIPPPLSQWIARIYYPRDRERVA